MLLATALALLIIVMRSTDVYCSKQTGGSSTKGNHYPSFLRFWNCRRKLSMQPKFVAAENVVKIENPANIRKWIARFYYFRHLYFRWKRVCIAHNRLRRSCPSIWATLSALLH